MRSRRPRPQEPGRSRGLLGSPDDEEQVRNRQERRRNQSPRPEPPWRNARDILFASKPAKVVVHVAGQHGVQQPGVEN